MHPYHDKVKAFEGSGAECEAYDCGLNEGHGLACHNKPERGGEYRTDVEKIEVAIDADLDELREAHIALCFAAESFARCYSPWEQIAARFNAAEEFEREALWEAYEQGVADAIEADVATYTLEDYA